MKLLNLCANIEYTCLQGDMNVEIKDLIYDSRKVEEGTAFVCMVGAVSDGHSYIPQVIEKGAKAIIIEKEEATAGLPADVTVIKVASTRYALALMSAAFFGYPDRELTTIGLTGTKGKTTTTYRCSRTSAPSNPCTLSRLRCAAWLRQLRHCSNPYFP